MCLECLKNKDKIAKLIFKIAISESIQNILNIYTDTIFTVLRETHLVPGNNADILQSICV